MAGGQICGRVEIWQSILQAVGSNLLPFLELTVLGSTRNVKHGSIDFGGGDNGYQLFDFSENRETIVHVVMMCIADDEIPPSRLEYFFFEACPPRRLILRLDGIHTENIQPGVQRRPKPNMA